MTSLFLGSPPALVLELQAQYLDSVRANYQSTPFLLESGRREIHNLLESRASVADIGDAHLFGLAEHYLWSDHRTKMTPLSVEDAFRPIGEIPTGEFPWAKAANAMRSFATDDVDAMLLRFKSRAAARPHLYEVHGCRTTMPWDVAGGQYLYLSQRGLHLYHSGGRQNFVSRLPSVSFFQELLNLCFGETGALLCLVPGMVEESVYNELHRLGYHPAGLSFQRELEEDEMKHPFLFAGHDIFFHALNWSLQVAPWRRTASALFYSVLREVAPEAFASPGPADLEWALDPELNRYPSVWDGVAETLKFLETKWTRTGLDRRSAISRTYLSRFPEIVTRCAAGGVPPEVEELRSSLMGLALA
jgi:hypothetical protein